MKNKVFRYLKKKIFLIVAAIPLLLEGCNTMEGLGTDIEHAGKALEKSAERNKDRPCPCCSSPNHCYKN